MKNHIAISGDYSAMEVTRGKVKEIMSKSEYGLGLNIDKMFDTIKKSFKADHSKLYEATFPGKSYLDVPREDRRRLGTLTNTDVRNTVREALVDHISNNTDPRGVIAEAAKEANAETIDVVAETLREMDKAAGKSDSKTKKQLQALNFRFLFDVNGTLGLDYRKIFVRLSQGKFFQAFPGTDSDKEVATLRRYYGNEGFDNLLTVLRAQAAVNVERDMHPTNAEYKSTVETELTELINNTADSFMEVEDNPLGEGEKGYLIPKVKWDSMSPKEQTAIQEGLALYNEDNILARKEYFDEDSQNIIGRTDLVDLIVRKDENGRGALYAEIEGFDPQQLKLKDGTPAYFNEYGLVDQKSQIKPEMPPTMNTCLLYTSPSPRD